VVDLKDFEDTLSLVIEVVRRAREIRPESNPFKKEIATPLGARNDMLKEQMRRY
jgi:hypothetical protein